ncbi:MAG: phosphoribosylaminoimidazolesuccinocarboxamide synthase [Candidatus Eisenbacteria bacterium]|nr:phosphoribosylaminoimidazolesuccinocarboxamide synthase [Candidatus Eisenbacteria bacterium]
MTDLGLSPSHSGKVRETLDLGDRLLLVTTDRISAFDCILPTLIPGKGILLNEISAWWFRGLEPHLPTHFLSDQDSDFPADLKPLLPELRGRWMLARKAKRIDDECVVRGYLAGSAIEEYARKGTIGGMSAPPGIAPYGKLPAPLFTPTTKEEVGHDRPVTLEELSDIVGSELAERLREASLRVYDLAERYARARGLLLVDTKFEFGWIDGRLSLIDEALTPDSSRYWDGARSASPPDPLDKEYVRAWLKTLDWDRNPPAPALPPEQVAETYRRYRLVHDRLGASGPPPRLGGEASGTGGGAR